MTETIEIEKQGKQKQENTAKPFWSGLDYIIDIFRGSSYINAPGTDIGIKHKSITLSQEEWQVIMKHYAALEKSILDTWEDLLVLEADLDEMKSLHPDDLEEYRKADVGRVEDIMTRLERFVDNDKIKR